MDDLSIEGTFPIIISPSLSVSNFEDTKEIIKKHKPELEKLLLQGGALLFRGFPVKTAADFSDFIETLNLGKFINYIGGDSPRNIVEKHIYTSTEAPPSFHIPLHQELSYIKNFPKHIYFFCEVEPMVGGSTVIAEAKKILKNLDSEIVQRFQQNGLKYVSHYYHKSKVMEFLNRLQRSHKSWTEVFETDLKDEVEKKCIENEFEWKWLSNDWIEIIQKRPALFEHPITNDTVWFNQAHIYDFNPKLLGSMKYIGAKLFYINKSMRLHEIFFQDGNPIPRKDLYHILDVMTENTVYFPWKKSDVLVIDNILAMHGRAPFKGKRRILAAMTA